MRSMGLDVHRDFCEVAIFEDGKVTRHPRVPACRPALGAFARSLRPTDQVGLEATGNALAIARLIEPHVARVVVVNAAVTKGIGNTRAKTDQLDARTLDLWVPRTCPPSSRGHQVLGDEVTHVYQRQPRRCACPDHHTDYNPGR